MSTEIERKRIETRVIVVGYAMSRLDSEYLRARGATSWNQAYIDASNCLSVPKNSFKNLRDEYDPYHSNSRKGWHQRSLRKNRQTVLTELEGVGDEALVELVSTILSGDEEKTLEAIDSLAKVSNVAANVAERLLTGRRAEEFFLGNCQSILNIDRASIIDRRNDAIGFDFGLRGRPELAIEIKGMKAAKGEILFTDKEWSVAKARKSNYILVVVGNLALRPRPILVENPFEKLAIKCRYHSTITALWSTRISV